MAMDRKPTQDLLFDAAVDLLARRSFDDICVTDICGRANVHRSTFYKYYADKYELLELQFRSLIVQACSGGDAPLRFLQHVQENTRLYKPLLLDPKNCGAERIFCRQLARRLTETAAADTESAAYFLAGGLLSAAAWWLRIENLHVPADRLRSDLDRFFLRP